MLVAVLAMGLVLATLTACGPKTAPDASGAGRQTVTVGSGGDSGAPGASSPATSTPTTDPTTPDATGAPETPGTTPSAPMVTDSPTTGPTAGAGDGTGDPDSTGDSDGTGGAGTPAVLRPGDKGPAVLALQRSLSDLGYWLGTPDGSFGGLTLQAVYALQGAAGLGRDGVVGPATRKALDAGVLPAVKSSGNALEIDLSQGTIAFVRNGKPWRVLHTSTGNGGTYQSGDHLAVARTPRGTFSVQRRIDGVRVAPLGRLYRPIYFYGGYAVHGSGSIPAYPASHGCARVSNSAIVMNWREGLMPNGLRVIVSE
jgi:hypothetical protein